jgi:hypothetical protein
MSGWDGRGRWYRWDKRETTDDYIRLDMATFAKSVDLTVWRWGTWHWHWSNGRESWISYRVEPEQGGVRLTYTVNKTEGFDYLVSVTYTTPNYGGRRPWWLCPTCYRRVRILYGGRMFACRQCTGVYYETQQSKALLVRIDNQLYRIRRRLAGDSKITEHLPILKPKYMHWRTYSRLAMRYYHLQKLRILSIGAEVMDMGELMYTGRRDKTKRDNTQAKIKRQLSR